MAKKKKQGRVTKYVIAFGSVILLFLLIIGFSFYKKIYAPNVSFSNDKKYLFIPSGSRYDDLIRILTTKKIVRCVENFKWVSAQMNLDNNVHPGRYKLQPYMSNYDLVLLLRSGKQEPVKLVINKFRTKQDLASFVSHQLETDSATLIYALKDEVYLRKFGLKPETAMALFIPNTYEFFWNVNAEQFMDRMKKENDHFWNAARKEEAVKIGLNPVQVIILASIVEEESNYNPEKGIIAGVYINRLRKDMILQADPTVKFAVGNFSLKRVLNMHTRFESPYNTYLHKGLPPGPICTPSVASIDAVLHSVASDYLYFCANPDKPGTHVFSKTYAEQELNAMRYQRWLNQRGI
ncbi:MAG: endolytic transglycosylase MltG [Chitinophagales bacterium]|nr:endolytic transglycosylase MltG [Chitinophagales bacterium]